eukprot:TRINITY_DN18246_c0_g1_i1.p1 TRINITY_DN18246_c0_g1~~TRINITY_DN18246_c0_g1_i1.p1  ORF type:complete len:388 (+),score=69.04 TRINITY_DN18246_c0_g1_i1:105-1268(+)
MGLLRLPRIVVLGTLFSVICVAQAQSSGCPTTVTVNGVTKTYSICVTYMGGGMLAFSYHASSLKLEAAYSDSPKRAYGWIAWGISPDGKMPTSSALLGWGDSTGGAPTVKGYYLPSYTEPQDGGSLQVLSSSIEVGNQGSNVTVAFTLQLDATHVQSHTIWARGGVVHTGASFIPPHNLDDSGTQIIDFSTGLASGGSYGGVDPQLRKRHGVLAAISWGTMLPLGVFVARYMRPFLDPLWFYTHWLTQLLAYLLGIAAFGIGIKLYSDSSSHKLKHFYLGIAIVVCGSLQVLAMALRPDKKSPIRLHWNIYHHSIGYACITMSIINCFEGFSLLATYGHWRTVYIIFLGVLGGAALIMEVITWAMWFQNRGDDVEDEEKPENGKLNG